MSALRNLLQRAQPPAVDPAHWEPSLRKVPKSQQEAHLSRQSHERRPLLGQTVAALQPLTYSVVVARLASVIRLLRQYLVLLAGHLGSCLTSTMQKCRRSRTWKHQRTQSLPLPRGHPPRLHGPPPCGLHPTLRRQSVAQPYVTPCERRFHAPLPSLLHQREDAEDQGALIRQDPQLRKRCTILLG